MCGHGISLQLKARNRHTRHRSVVTLLPDFPYGSGVVLGPIRAISPNYMEQGAGIEYPVLDDTETS